MKRPVILAYDDLDHHERGELNEAPHTEIVGVDGDWYEVDLTDEHWAPVRALLVRLAAAGEKLDEPPAKTTKGKPPADSSVATFRRGYREWMTARGLEHELKSPSGYRYPVARMKEYQEYLESIPLDAVA